MTIPSRWYSLFTLRKPRFPLIFMRSEVFLEWTGYKSMSQYLPRPSALSITFLRSFHQDYRLIKQGQMVVNIVVLKALHVVICQIWSNGKSHHSLNVRDIAAKLVPLCSTYEAPSIEYNFIMIAIFSNGLSSCEQTICYCTCLQE